MRNKLGAPIRGNVGGNSMLGEDIEQEELSKLSGDNCVVGRNKDCLFGKPVNDH